MNFYCKTCWRTWAVGFKDQGKIGKDWKKMKSQREQPRCLVLLLPVQDDVAGDPEVVVEEGPQAPPAHSPLGQLTRLWINTNTNMEKGQIGAKVHTQIQTCKNDKSGRQLHCSLLTRASRNMSASLRTSPEEKGDEPSTCERSLYVGNMENGKWLPRLRVLTWFVQVKPWLAKYS